MLPITSKIEIHDQFVNHFKNKQELRYSTQLNEFVLQHKDLTNTTAGFRYHFKTYRHSNSRLPDYSYRKLHHSLRGNFEKFLSSLTAGQERLYAIDEYARKVLRQVKYKEHLYYFFPECSHFLLPKCSKDKQFERLTEKQKLVLDPDVVKKIKLELLMGSM